MNKERMEELAQALDAAEEYSGGEILYDEFSVDGQTMDHLRTPEHMPDAFHLGCWRRQCIVEVNMPQSEGGDEDGNIYETIGNVGGFAAALAYQAGMHRQGDTIPDLARRYLELEKEQALELFSPDLDCIDGPETIIRDIEIAPRTAAMAVRAAAQGQDITAAWREIALREHEHDISVYGSRLAESDRQSKERIRAMEDTMRESESEGAAR